MALQKQPLAISFGQGLDTKTDPNQVVAGKMLQLENAIFDKGGLLQKRNGFPLLTTLPTGNNATNLTTFQGSLLATGQSMYAYNPETQAWLSKGSVQPVGISTSAVVRSSASQVAPDAAVSANGLMCTVYAEGSQYYYRISDSNTGQSVGTSVALPATAVNARAYLLGNYFVILFGATVAASPHLQYIAVPTGAPSNPSVATDITTQFSAINAAYDACVANNKLYVAWNGNDGGGALRMAYLTSTLVNSATRAIAGYNCNLISVSVDIATSTPVVYISFVASNVLYVCSRDQNLAAVLAPVSAVSSSAINTLASIANNGSCTTLYQLTAAYPSAVRSDSLNKVVVSAAGSVTTPGTAISLGVGLASKPFLFDGTMYVLAAYSSSYQPTYFLLNFSGNVLAKLAYQNGGGYASTFVLPNATVTSVGAQIPYLLKDSIQSVSKAISGTDKQIYSQTGINLATFSIANAPQYSAEAGNSLQLTGGQLWQFDGIAPVEHGFHLWPEDVTAATAGTGGLITAQQYYYVFCYEWTDGQGMLHRSAPSLPVGIVTTGTTSTNTLVVPTLRMTAKTSANPVRIVGYRWSTAQQNYFQFTSITSPILNDTTVNTVTITDTLADLSILGNTLLYTTGGVVENIGAPPCTASTLSRNRMWLIDAEDQNLAWYSKQILSATPVEFSDLLTVYVAPTTGVQGSTGPTKCISAMDDKTIFFKADAIYYITGNGPDNTGAQNDFSEPTFITSAVGCSNPASIVLTPMGLMFQSDKGIWLLDRSLGTKYVGDAVEAYNAAQVVSAISVPGTNQIRFTLNNDVTLMYDYYFGQWSTFVGAPAISSTLYNSTHTMLNGYSQVVQESDGYLDAAGPVLIKFTTSWLKLAGLQGYQRAYWFYILGKYLTPHTLNFQIAYDYDPAAIDAVLVLPTNYSAAFGGDSVFGDGQFGGESAVEQWQIYLAQQKCQAVRISMQESFDASFGVTAGQGFTLSGLNLMIGVKAGEPQLAAKFSAG